LSFVFLSKCAGVCGTWELAATRFKQTHRAVGWPVAAVCLLILGEFVFIRHLISNGMGIRLILGPVFGRWAIVQLIFLCSSNSKVNIKGLVLAYFWTAVAAVIVNPAVGGIVFVAAMAIIFVSKRMFRKHGIDCNDSAMHAVGQFVELAVYFAASTAGWRHLDDPITQIFYMIR
jgi:hypothetical protein